MDAQVLIQAGHEGGKRNSGTGSKPTYGAGGTTRPENEMTPIVADGAAAWLEHFGVSVIKENAFYDKRYSVELAVSLHFDGSGRPCASGASIGYPKGVPVGSNKPTANLWKDIYEQYWPYQWMPDNFTSNLSGYYGYAWTSTSVAELLIEFGEVSCPEQDAWLQPRVGETAGESWLGLQVAYFCSEALGLGVVPDPGPFHKEDDLVKRQWELVRTSYERLGRRLDKLERMTT